MRRGGGAEWGGAGAVVMVLLGLLIGGVEKGAG